MKYLLSRETKQRRTAMKEMKTKTQSGAAVKVPFCKYVIDAGFKPNQSPTK